ncbi:hypothetical protein F4818DRAFT_405740 [Hypoxylon cercidicola]|nr:hypothetical protein F4818DRAFT_405740 [Hypoxylon cercidicola]
MHIHLSLLTFGGVLVLSGPSAANGYLLRKQENADVVSVTLPASGSVHGSLVVHRTQMAQYYKNEVGIDVDRLHSYQERSVDSSSGNHAFPEGSGIEGVLSWNLTDRNTPSVPYRQQMTCDDCWFLCAVPFVGPTLCSMETPPSILSRPF